MSRTLPQLARLRRRIAGEAKPVVVLQGWPGSGRRALLAALAEEPDSELSSRSVILQPLATADWQTFAAGLAGMPEPPRLLLAADGPTPAGLDIAAISPAELALDAAEAATLLGSGDERRVDRALWLTDGWYRPLVELAESAEPDDLAGAVAWAASRFVAQVTPAARAVLEALSAGPPVELAAACRAFDGDAALRAGLDALLETFFFCQRDGDATLRVPPVLAVALRHPAAGDGDRALARAACAALATVAGRRGDAVRFTRLAGRADPAGSRQRPATPAVRLRLLGAPRIEARRPDGSWQEVRWRLRRAFELVAFLALAPERRASRDELIEALWPDADQGAVRRNFHPTVSDARRTLQRALASSERVLVCSRERYGFDPAVEWEIDVDTFLDDAEAGPADADPALELARGRRAWRRYRGPLLDGSYAVWIEDRRDEVHRRYLDLLRRLGALAAARGETEQAIDAYRTVLIEEAFEEPLHLGLMELYARQGRRDLVRAQFLRLQQSLRELGVTPRAETQRRYDELMRATIPAS